MTNAEKGILGIVMVVLGLALIALLVSLQVVIVAGISMLLCNWVLPMFDVNYIITFWQGCGIGVGYILVRGLLGGVVSVKAS